MPDALLVATRKGLFNLKHKGGAWSIDRVDFLGDPVPNVLHDPRDGTLYAALNLGHFGHKLHRSDDAGRTWTEITGPAYPPKPDDAPVVRDAMRNLEIPWAVKMIWSLAIDPRSDGALWCGTLPGGLFHSPDRGQSWQLNRPLWDHPKRAKWAGGGYDYPGIHSILPDPRDPRKLTLGISTGGVWASDDGGATWANRSHGMRAAYMPPDQAFDVDAQDPHIVVQCPANPDVKWSQHHNGIFRTTDGCQSWHEIENVSPSAFGFAAAVHPEQPDTAWFVPAIKDERRVPVDGKFVVTRTTDGGKSFDILRKGLPQNHAYDIVYRHALDVDDTGSHLAMGSTTGSLWASSDGGDGWQTINANLPPIYAVKLV